MHDELKKVIDAGVKNLCVDTLGLKLTQGRSLGRGFYGASIAVMYSGGEWNFYLFFKRVSLEIFARALLGQDRIVDADLDDLCKELANQIIGKSKNILNEKHPGKYKLGTPEFLGEVSNFKLRLDEKIIYKLNGRTFCIGYKKDE